MVCTMTLRGTDCQQPPPQMALHKGLRYDPTYLHRVDVDVHVQHQTAVQGLNVWACGGITETRQKQF